MHFLEISNALVIISVIISLFRRFGGNRSNTGVAGSIINEDTDERINRLNKLKQERDIERSTKLPE